MAALKFNRIENLVVTQPTVFLTIFSQSSNLSLSLSVFFFIIALMQGPLNIISHC